MAKTRCESRTYEYVLPTWVLRSKNVTKEDFAYTEIVKEKFLGALKVYQGTHNFHNFTNSQDPNDRRAQRFVKSIHVGSIHLDERLERISCVW